jgi:hypothetical protein
MQDLTFTTRNSIQDSTEKRKSGLFHNPEPLQLSPLALQKNKIHTNSPKFVCRRRHSYKFVCFSPRIEDFSHIFGLNITQSGEILT